MSFKFCFSPPKRLLAAIFCVAALGGCSSHDYLGHSDRVAYSTGNAVRANMAIQTTDPSSTAMNDTSGLGKNGDVIPVDATTILPGGTSSLTP